MRKIGFAVVGTNFISDRFAEAVAALDSVEIRAVYSRKLDTGRHFADKYGIKKAYSDYSAMLSDGDIDAVYIASPTLCHKDHAEAALMANKHVLCEKMITTTESELDALIALARERRLVLLEAMRPDFDPAYDTLRSALEKIGKIRRATLELCQYSSRYGRFLAGEVLNAFDPKMKNSALSDIGIYPLNISVNLFGSPNNVIGDSVFLNNGFEGMGRAVLFYDQMRVVIKYSKITNCILPSVIEGEEGSILIDKLTQPSSVTIKFHGGLEDEIYRSKENNNMVYEIEAFEQMCRGVIDHHSYLNVTEKTQLLVDSIYKTSGIDKKF